MATSAKPRSELLAELAKAETILLGISEHMSTVDKFATGWRIAQALRDIRESIFDVNRLDRDNVQSVSAL